jgi:type IV pilus assembly protein PilW
MMRRASPTISCASGTWNTLNEPEIEITNVTFTLIETAFNITSMITDANNDGRMDGDDNNNKICDAGEVCRTCVINPVAPSPACNFARAVTISLTGRIKSDTTISQTLTEEVRVRNDQFFPAK